MKNSAWYVRPCAWKGGRESASRLLNARNNPAGFGFHHCNSCFVSHRDMGRGSALIVQCIDHPLAGDRIAGIDRSSDVESDAGTLPANLPADFGYQAGRQQFLGNRCFE